MKIPSHFPPRSKGARLLVLAIVAALVLTILITTSIVSLGEAVLLFLSFVFPTVYQVWIQETER